jgi:hypothetical protein
MRLPDSFGRFFGQEEERESLYLAILFEQARLVVAVFTSPGRQVNILSFKSAPYSGKLEDSERTLDRLLASLADEVSQVDELEEAIFGFPQEYIENDTIKPDVGRKLKKIVKHLSLKPKGYVVISEALAFYLSSKSGSQESAIFAGVYKKELRISLVKIGKITEEKSVARTKDVSFDIETALNSFKQEVLPAKIVLYNSTHDLNSVKDNLLKHPWEKKCNFLHFPKIEILPSLTTLQAVIGAYTNTSRIAPGRKAGKEETEIVSPEELGFTKKEETEQEEERKVEKIDKESDKKRLPRVENIFGALSTIKSRIVTMLPFKRIYLLGILIIVGGIVGLLFLFGNMSASGVQVRILVDTKNFKQDLEFTLDPKVESIDVENKIIPASKVAVVLEGEKSKDTEGTDLIGDPAVGKVTIFNKTTKEKLFKKGEIIIAGNKVKFTLDKDTKVASATEEDTGLTYGKGEVAVTAVNIGPEGNIDSGGKLVFEDFSKDDYSAKSKEDFSGGTSREVSVVSKDDVAYLRKKILAELSKKAKQEIESKKGGELVVLDETLKSEIEKETLSKKVGEQAKKVSLKASFKFTALAFSQDDIVTLLRANAESNFPEGFTMKDGLGRQKILDKKVNKDGSVSFTSSFATTLLPEIDIDDMKSKLAGKKKEEIEKYLKDKKNIGGFELIFDKKLLFLPYNSLPKDPSKIKITIVTR